VRHETNATSGLTLLAPSIHNAALRRRSSYPPPIPMQCPCIWPPRRAGAHAALVIDSAGYHVAARLAVSRNITLIRLPPYAPELNRVENVWEYLRDNNLAITVFEIVNKSCAPRGASSPTTRTRRINHIQNLGDGQSLRPFELADVGAFANARRHKQSFAQSCNSTAQA
jgi:hypothetical protein